MPKVELELIKYDYVDCQHMLFKPGCFGDIVGDRVMLCLEYDIRRVIAQGILFERDNAIWIRVDSLPEKYKNWEVCASFTVPKMPLDQSPNGDFREISKARLEHVAGLVTRGKKIH